MEYLAYGLAAVLIFYALGLGLTLWILPAQLRRYSLIIAPWVGYWYVALTCLAIYELGGRITSGAALVILLPPLLCLALILFAKGFAIISSSFLSREVLRASCLAAAAFLFFSLPVLWNNQGPTTVSLFNHDVAAYATVSRFFTDFTRTSSVGFVGQGSHFFNLYAAEGYFGVVSFAGFLAAIFGLMPHQTTTLCIDLFAALGVASLFLFLYDILKVRARIAYLGIALFGFHPAFQYVVLQGFFGQIVAIGLSLMIIWIHAKLIEMPGKPRDLVKYLLLLACFTSGLLLTYQHMVPFVWIFAGVYSVVLAFYRRSALPLWRPALCHLAAFAVAAALSPPRVLAYLEYFKWIAEVQAGWFVPFFSPDYLTGLSYQNGPFVAENPQIHLIVAIVVGAAVCLWLLIAVRTFRQTSVAVWIGCLVIYAGAVILGLRGENGRMGGYKSFKLVIFFLPFFVAAAACLFDSVPAIWRRLSLGLKMLALVSLAIGYVRADIRLFEAMRAVNKSVPSSYRDLLGIDKDNRIQSVNVLGQDGWESMWAAYFIMHKNVYIEGATHWGQPSPLVGAYDLLDTSNTVEAMRHLPDGHIPEIRRVNERLYLVGPIPKQ